MNEPELQIIYQAVIDGHFMSMRCERAYAFLDCLWFPYKFTPYPICFLFFHLCSKNHFNHSILYHFASIYVPFQSPTIALQASQLTADYIVFSSFLPLQPLLFFSFYVRTAKVMQNVVNLKMVHWDWVSVCVWARKWLSFMKHCSSIHTNTP